MTPPTACDSRCRGGSEPDELAAAPLDPRWTVCSWCGSVHYHGAWVGMESLAAGDGLPLDEDGGVKHGMCDRCFETVMRDLEPALRRRWLSRLTALRRTRPAD